MHKLALLAVSALALTGCDKMPFGGGGTVEANGSVAGTNAASTSNAASDAGVTSSRSLAGLGGSEGGSPDGGKDPAAASAIPASASQGGIDPRLVGRWSDNGSCNDISELRADGTFVANNGVTTRWSVVGDYIVFSTKERTIRLHIESVEPNRIVTTNEQGQSGPSIRC